MVRLFRVLLLDFMILPLSLMWRALLIQPTNSECQLRVRDKITHCFDTFATSTNDPLKAQDLAVCIVGRLGSIGIFTLCQIIVSLTNLTTTYFPDISQPLL